MATSDLHDNPLSVQKLHHVLNLNKLIEHCTYACVYDPVNQSSLKELFELCTISLLKMERHVVQPLSNTVVCWMTKVMCGAATVYERSPPPSFIEGKTGSVEGVLPPA